MANFFYILIYIAFFGSIIGVITFAIIKAIIDPSSVKQVKHNDNAWIDEMTEDSRQRILATQGLPSSHGDLS